MEAQPVAYAIQNDQGYWVGVWNDREIAERVLSKGLPAHGERIVPLFSLEQLAKAGM